MQMQTRKQFRGEHVLVLVHAPLARNQLKPFSRGEGRRFKVHRQGGSSRKTGNANTGASMVVIVMMVVVVLLASKAGGTFFMLPT